MGLGLGVVMYLMTTNGIDVMGVGITGKASVIFRVAGINIV
jgi:hypothetical protein